MRVVGLVKDAVNNQLLKLKKILVIARLVISMCEVFCFKSKQGLFTAHNFPREIINFIR